ncbi:MAG: hypothetical protein ACXV5Q_00810 [Frankiaceae bacterium]
MSALSDVLAKHIGHKASILPSLMLKCWDCSHSIDLTPRAASVRPTSTSTPINLKDNRQCPAHVGFLAHNCSCCRSEKLAGEAS